MLEDGLTRRQIAEHFGVSYQAVDQFAKRYGLIQPSLRQIALEHYPWESAKFKDSSIDRRMRDHAEYMVTHGEGMQEWKIDRLRRFYRHLIALDLVVEFDPTIPPGEMPAKHPKEFGDTVGGFALRDRRKRDGTLMIRVNRHTKLTPEGHALWVVPEELP